LPSYGAAAKKPKPEAGQSAANARRTEAAPTAATPPLTVAENDSKRAYLKAKASATNTLEESQTTSGVTVQRFAQVEPGTATAARFESSSAAQPVLAAFQVEQRGQEVRVVDSDGSVYLGYLQPADAETRKRALEVESARPSRALNAAGEKLRTPAASRPPANLETNYVFRVAGTNRTLNQNVVFTATLSKGPVESRLDGITNSVNGFGAALKNSLSDSGALPLSNLRISGKVSIGGRPELEIRAVPAAVP